MSRKGQILRAMLHLGVDHFSTVAEIEAEAPKHGRKVGPDTIRRYLRQLVIDGLVIEWGPIERLKKRPGRNPTTWQLTAEGEAAAMEDDLP